MDEEKIQKSFKAVKNDMKDINKRMNVTFICFAIAIGFLSVAVLVLAI